MYNEVGITLPDNFEAGEDKKDEEDKNVQKNNVQNKRTLEKDNKMNEEMKLCDAALIDREAERKSSQRRDRRSYASRDPKEDRRRQTQVPEHFQYQYK